MDTSLLLLTILAVVGLNIWMVTGIMYALIRTVPNLHIVVTLLISVLVSTSITVVAAGSLLMASPLYLLTGELI